MSSTDTDAKPFSSSTTWTVIRAILILLTVIVWYEAGAKRGAQIAGLSLVIQSCVFLKQGSVPYGWRGSPPSGFITGPSAVFWSLLLAAIGAAVLVRPDIVAALFANFG